MTNPNPNEFRIPPRVCACACGALPARSGCVRLRFRPASRDTLGAALRLACLSLPPE